MEILKSLVNFDSRFLSYLLILVVSFSVGLFAFKTSSRSYKTLTTLILLTFLSEFLSEILFQNEITTSNFPFYHVLQVIQIAFVGHIYFLLFKSIGYYSKLYLSVTYSLTAVTLFVSFTIQPFSLFPSFGAMIQSLFFVFSALLLFYKLIQVPSETPILKQAAFWFNSGNLFFYATTFILFGFYQDFQNSNLTIPSWGFRIIAGANFILYPCYLISILLNARENKNGRHPH